MTDPTARFIDVGPTEARRLLELNRGNRNLKKLAVARYAEDMIAGRWKQTGDPIRISKTDRLLDGQNRLSAVIQSGRTIRFLVVTGLDDESQVAMDQGVRRSGADALGLAGRANASYLASAVKVHHSWATGALKTTDSYARAMTNGKVVDYLDDNPGIADLVAPARSVSKVIGLTPTPMIAAFYELSLIDAEATASIMNRLIDLDLHGKGDPLAALVARARTLTGYVVAPGAVLFLIFRTWNAVQTRRPLVKLLLDSKGAALTIPAPVQTEGATR